MVIEALMALMILSCFLALWSASLMTTAQAIERSSEDEKKMRAFETLLSSIETGENAEGFWGHYFDQKGCGIESSGNSFDSEIRKDSFRQLPLHHFSLLCKTNDQKEILYGETLVSLALI